MDHHANCMLRLFLEIGGFPIKIETQISLLILVLISIGNPPNVIRIIWDTTDLKHYIMTESPMLLKYECQNFYKQKFLKVSYFVFRKLDQVKLMAMVT